MTYILLILIIAVLIFIAIQLRELAKVLIYTTGVEEPIDEYTQDDYLIGEEDLAAFLNSKVPSVPDEKAIETQNTNNFLDLFPKTGVEVVTDEDEVGMDKPVRGGYYE